MKSNTGIENQRKKERIENQLSSSSHKITQGKIKNPTHRPSPPLLQPSQNTPGVYPATICAYFARSHDPAPNSNPGPDWMGVGIGSWMYLFQNCAGVRVWS